MSREKQKDKSSTSEQGSQNRRLEEEQLVRDHIGWMLALAQRLLRERSLAEDAVQDAFIAAFAGWPNFEGRSSLKTWLYRITVNSSLMKLRKIKRLGEQSIDEYLPEFDRLDCRIEAPWSHLARIEDIMESDRLRAIVNQKVAMLPESYRIVLLLRDIEGNDTSEVSSLLGISEANVKVRLHRARSALKKLLEPTLRGKDSG